MRPGALRQLPARLFTAAVMAAVVMAAVLGGQTYRWCLVLQGVAQGCCDVVEVGDLGPAADSLDCGCCQTKTVAPLPSGQANAPTPDVPPPFVSALPDCASAAVRSASAPSDADAARVMPPPSARARAPTAAGRCAALQVYRC